MTTKRIALASLAVAVLVAVAFLIVSATSSSAGKSSSSPKVRQASAGGRTEVVDAIPKTRKGHIRAHDSEAPPVAPSIPDDGTETTPDGTTVYTKDDGTVVRDHRTAGPRELPPLVFSREATVKVRNDLRPLVQECGKPIRRRRDGTKGKLQADLTLSVSDGRMRVDELDLHVTGLSDSEYTTCVRSALEGFEMFAPDGQKDVARHTVSLPFNVP